MATQTLTYDNFMETLENNDILLIDFYADWCGPCKMFAPIFERTSEKYPDIKFAKVDTEAEQQLAAEFGIRSIPSLAVFREKVLVFMQPGALPEKVLVDIIEQVKDIDMAEVHKEIEESKASAA
ncbi:MAG: thioredoxin [Deltaproteobacteria bacterium]|nr:MAG: thioredoxin [Deltaproteobacteria bacterium]